ncbi:ABC transporter ATP-binding protein, partial [Mycobacterium tuberculosis]|nr:ABC transporter ATP-binding protein [Mycobacterium tuberculosis]
FDLGRGETLGIVGESGSGKSLLSLAVMGLLPPAARIDGRIALDGRDLLPLNDDEMCEVRGRRIGMIFQEPMTALNPAMRIADQIAEGLVRHRLLGRQAARARAVELLDRVRIPNARQKADAYPHEMSGGQRQRVGIAIALALEPDLIIADEPTTALDVTVQAEILDILDDLVRGSRMSLILISHDLGVVARAADRTIVMYAGTRMEAGPTADVLHRPLNPYTRGLLSAMPRRRARPSDRLATIAGAVPGFDALPPGCRFAGRCPAHIPACDAAEPAWEIAGEGRGVRCIRAMELAEVRP